MSLFKLLNLWSLSLNKLEELEHAEEVDTAAEKSFANFTVCPGKFKSIGEHDVFVCGSLSGLICIVQVLEDKQADSTQGARQLLALKYLSQPVIDLKCGFFSSTVKQSIAVLNFEELTIYQVKKCQLDLISGGSSVPERRNAFVDDSLFSHVFEEMYKFSLQPCEMAAGIVSMAHCSHAQISSRPNHGQAQVKKNSNDTSSLNLPQRDNIVVRYRNQFLFTLINHKKVIAHYELHYQGESTDSGVTEKSILQIQQLSCFVGAQAMALMHDSTSESLLIAMSTNKLYNFNMNKLIAMSRENVMKRVVESLLSTNSEVESKFERPTSPAGNEAEPSATSVSNIAISLDKSSEWQVELIGQALEIVCVTSENLSTGQIVILHRYNVDLYSNLGFHLWSYRSETPLICMSCHTQAEQGEVKVITLVCSDSMIDERSNLLVLENELKVWSSLVYGKPSRIWRTNLRNISGAIASMNSTDSCISVGYLGTNLDTDSDYNQSDIGETNFAQLESLTGSLFDDRPVSCDEQSSPRLDLDISLEASNQWPEVQVKTRISVRPDPNCHRILEDVIISLEFDDLLNFSPDERVANNATRLNEGAIEVRLGTYWIDGREPIFLSGTFSLKPIIPTKPMHAIPKTMEVIAIIKFSSHKSRVLVQYETFMLPSTLVASLSYMEYICENQVVDDSGTFDFCNSFVDTGRKYHIALAIDGRGKLVEFVDNLIESDLVCRGFNLESAENQLRVEKIRSEHYASTMENISLLTQSLDCRLRYKSQGQSKRMTRQPSEEYSPLIAVVVAFRFMNSTLFPSLDLSLEASGDGDDPEYSTVWLHLYDFSTTNLQLSKEVRRHLRDSNVCKGLLEKLVGKKKDVLLVVIGSEHPLALLIIQQHLLRRLESFGPDAEVEQMVSCTDADVQLGYHLFYQGKNQIVINSNMCHCLEELQEKYDSKIRKQFERLKEDLDRSYYKFHLSTMAVLSYSKNLPNLPDDVPGNFDILTAMNKKHQSKLIEILSNIEKLQELDRQYSKIPNINKINLRTHDGKCLTSIEFSRIID